MYCYADRIAPRPIADPPEGRVERLREIFRHYGGPVREVLAQIESPDQLHFSAIEDVLHAPWGRGRVVLIGDVAHAMSPNMACGAAMAFEDALVLAGLISQHGAVSGIVPEFIHRRSARVGWVRRQTNARDRLRSLPPVIRNAFLRLLTERTYRANDDPRRLPRKQGTWSRTKVSETESVPTSGDAPRGVCEAFEQLHSGAAKVWKGSIALSTGPPSGSTSVSMYAASLVCV